MKIKITIKNLVLLALLIALNVILSRFLKIPLSSFARITFGFVAIALMGTLFGPWYAALGAGLADIIGFLLFPSGEPFFIGFTLTAMVLGIIYGVLFYQKKSSLPRIILAQILVFVICNALLNTLWLSILTGKAFLVILGPRLLKNIITLPIDCFILFIMFKYLWGTLKSAILNAE